MVAYLKALLMCTGAYVIMKLLYNVAWDLFEKKMFRKMGGPK